MSQEVNTPHFFRTKLMTAWPKDVSVVTIRGLLEDDIYGLEVRLDVDIESMSILSMEADWIRMENSQCWRALPVVKELVGHKISQDSDEFLQKVVGRRGCRHFAELIWECFDLALEIKERSAQVIPLEQTSSIQPKELFGKAQMRTKWPHIGELSHREDKTILDLHVHTYPASTCSSIHLEDAIEVAKGKGIDGIVLTDHNYIWPQRELLRWRDKYGFLILGAAEITTDQGDILVYYKPQLERALASLDHPVSLRRLKELMKDNAFLAVAHPFRGFLTFGLGLLNLNVEEASKREVFRWVDGVEVLNVKVGDPENQFATEVAQTLDLKVIGGSDSHTKKEVGQYGTAFEGKIVDESDLVEMLLNGSYTPVKIG